MVGCVISLMLGLRLLLICLCCDLAPLKGQAPTAVRILLRERREEQGDVESMVEDEVEDLN